MAFRSEVVKIVLERAAEGFDAFEGFDGFDGG